METVSVYVLTEEKKVPKGPVLLAVVGVTTDITEAEEHKAKAPTPSGGGYIEYDFQEFPVQVGLFTMGAETTTYLKEMRSLKSTVLGFQQALADQAMQEPQP